MPKRELHRFHVRAPFKQRGRKLVIRLKDIQASALESPRVPKAEEEAWQDEHERRSFSERSANNSLSDAKQPASSALVPLKPHRFQNRFWRWTLLWLSIFSIMGVAVTAGVLLLTQLPPPIDCRKISPLSADGDRLYCAQRAAESGKLEQLVAAIRLVQNWPSQHPLYPEAQRQMSAWSRVILDLAQQKILQGTPSDAIAVASKIPGNSPLYGEAQAKIITWKQQLKRAEEISSQFKEALKGQNWFRASQLVTQLSQLSQDPWNFSRVNTLLDQLTREKDAWQQLETARELAKSNTLEQLKEAIALTTQIGPNIYVKAQVLKEQSQWSRNLIQMATTLFEQQNFTGVVNALESIPATAPEHAAAQDWMELSRASETVKKNNSLAFVDALAAARLIAPKSPVYKLASSKAMLWQQQLQDLNRLQWARLAASSQQRAGLAYAIKQASQIAPQRPQRLVAQTLIAQWRKEIQQIDDRNMLASARQLSAGETMVELKAAVKLASQIKVGQPLRIDAQTEIAKWNKQIQSLEDQPILDLAEALAQRQDLIAAISTAGQIRSDRPLYSEAQKAIAKWVAQVQTVQDRPILDAASALAAQGRFDAAIATASQIPADRALYQQAQAAIARWASQKAANSSQTQSVPLDAVVPLDPN